MQTATEFYNHDFSLFRNELRVFFMFIDAGTIAQIVQAIMCPHLSLELRDSSA